MKTLLATLLLATRLQNVPPAEQARVNPYEGSDDAAMAGAKLYKRHCAACHGAEGNGRRNNPGLRSPTVQKATPGALFWLLKHGNLRRGMPSWSHLPEQQRWQIVTYLKSLAQSGN